MICALRIAQSFIDSVQENKLFQFLLNFRVLARRLRAEYILGMDSIYVTAALKLGENFCVLSLLLCVRGKKH
jgi:hypothetical protein